MDQQAADVAAKPHWMIDLAVGLAGALAAITVAQAALPVNKAEPVRLDGPAVSLGGLRQIAAQAPAFAFGEPVAGYEVVSPFGLRKLPWEEAGRLHAGVDIAAPTGYPVQASADGWVMRVGYDGGYGRFVEVRHAEGLTSLYGHLSGIASGVMPGTRVRMGDPIGQVGSTGSSTGAHLHFELHDAYGRPLNPELFMGRRFADVTDLPLEAAARIPRGVRVAYVSYIPRRKRELMETLKAAKQEPAGDQVASLGVAKPTAQARLTVSRPQTIHLPPVTEAAPISTWRGDPYGIDADLPGWPSSGS